MLVTSNKLKLSIAGGTLALGLISGVGLSHMNTTNNASSISDGQLTPESSVDPAQALAAEATLTPSPSDPADPGATPTPSASPTTTPTPSAAPTATPMPSATPPMEAIHTTTSTGQSVIITHN